jgi:hypothetical protein
MKRVMCLLEGYEVGCEMTPGMFLALGWAAGQDVNEIQGVVGLIAAIYAWQKLVATDAIWELVWQIRDCLASGVPCGDILHDLNLLFGKPSQFFHNPI